MSKIDKFTESFFAEQLKCIEKLSKQKNQIEKIISLLIKKRNTEKTVFTMVMVVLPQLRLILCLIY